MDVVVKWQRETGRCQNQKLGARSGAQRVRAGLRATIAQLAVEDIEIDEAKWMGLCAWEVDATLLIELSELFLFGNRTPGSLKNM